MERYNMTEREEILNTRRQFLAKIKNINKKKGLEIGPLDAPLVTRDILKVGGEIFYLDHLPTDELREKYQGDCSVDIEQVVPIDFICPDGDLLKAVNGKKFDYIIASHVIEHSSNVLKFLSDISTMLVPGGSVLLVVPDKRFSFDKYRSLTTFGMLLERFLTDQKRPSISSVYDHFALATHASAHNIWHGIENKEDLRTLTPDSFAWEAARRVNEKSAYFDVHVNIFTPASFFDILTKACKHEIFFLKVADFLDTKVGQLEFMVALKTPTDEDTHSTKLSCLKSVPQMPLETLLSPYMPQVKSLSNALESVAETANGLQKEVEISHKRIQNSMEEIGRVQAQLDTAQRMLKRRSVQIVLSLVDALFRLIRANKK